MTDEYIVLGGGAAIGKVRVEESTIRGEGGWNLPQLVVPIKFEIDPQTPQQELAIVELKASLFSDRQLFAKNLVCQPILIGLTNGFIAWSMSNGKPSSQPLELRFFPTQLNIEVLERTRQAAQSDYFDLFLKLEPTIVAAVHLNQQMAGEDAPKSPWNITFGMHSQLAPFWAATVQTLCLRIERTTWIERVLSEVGYDRVRLLEVVLPPSLPAHGSAAGEFDRARLALAERRFSDCVAACRGVISIWEKHLGADGKRFVADIVANQLQWDENDRRRKFVDDLWKAANDLSNVPHHPESQTARLQEIGADDARLMLMIVSALSEYLGKVL